MRMVPLVPKRACTALILTWCCLAQPGGARAQDIPTGAGSLDPSFFSARTAEPNWYDQPTVQRIAVQPDGAVLIGGSFQRVQGFARQSLARLLPTGSVDPFFVPPGLLNAYNYVRDLVLEPNGKITLAANATGLLRLDASGSPDASFEGRLNYGASAVVRLPSGEYLAGTCVVPTNIMARYGVLLLDAQGRPSQRWSSDYVSTTPVRFLLLSPDAHRLVVDGLAELSLDSSGANFNFLSNALPAGFWPMCGAFQPDGKLLLGRTASPPNQWNTNSFLPAALIRLNTDHTIDSTFTGNVSIGLGEFEGGRDQLRIDALALQSDGKILVGGFFTQVSGVPRRLLARLCANGDVDHGFTPDIEVNPGADIDAQQNVSAMSLAPDGRLVIGGVFTRINGLVCDAVARLHTAAETSGGVLVFSEDVYSAWETNGTVEVSVLRYGPSDQVVSVFYEALDLTPEIPVPAPQRGKLVFAPGETRKTFTLPLQDNLLVDGNHSFHVGLSHPVGGAVLTGNTETKIRIYDDEQPGRPGSVDLSYPQIPIQSSRSGVSLLAVEPDGSALLSVFWYYTDVGADPFSLMRCGPGGALDPTFHPSVEGQVLAAFPDPLTGKITIVGNYSTVSGQNLPNVARLNHDGSVDTGFPAIPITEAGGVNGAVMQPDGKLVIYGSFISFNNVPRQRVVRLLADGTVDPQFDTSAASWINSLTTAALQPDGKLVLGGNFAQEKILARLNADGSADASFIPPAFQYQWGVQSLLCQPDGKMLVGGYLFLADGRNARLIRLNGNGSLDDTFWASIPANYYGTSLLLQPDGKIIVGGTWRLNPDGSRDPSFFTGERSDSVSTAQLLPDGDLLVCGGFTSFEEWPRIQLARLNGGDAPLVGCFEFTQGYVSIREDAITGRAQLGIRRMGATNGTAIAQYNTIDGTARAGIDYVAVSNSVTFSPGEEQKTIFIPILNDSAYRGNRSFAVELRDMTPGLRGLGGPAALVDIVEDDPGLTFTRTNYWVYSGMIPTNGSPWPLQYVERHGDLSAPLTVECQVSAGTAIPGVDFIPTNVTVQFPADNFEATVLLPLLPNVQGQSDRTVLLTLTNANPALSLATDSAAVLTILGPSAPPHLLEGAGQLDAAGSLRWGCYLRPGQQVEVEASENLIDWSHLTWIYLDINSGLSPVFFEDPDAWKFESRFYRLPHFDGGPD